MTEEHLTETTTTDQDTTAVPAAASNPTPPPAPQPIAPAPVDPEQNAFSDQSREEIMFAMPPSPMMPSSGAPKKGIGAEIAGILKSVKLPERRAEKPVVPEPQTQTPALGALPKFELPKNPPTSPAATVQPTPAVITPPAAEAAPGQEAANEDGVASAIYPVHTMKNDLQETVRERKISVVRAAAMEQERRPHEAFTPMLEQTPRGTGKKIALLLVVILFVLCLTGAAVYAGYVLMQQNQTPAQQSSPSLIFAENQIAFPISNQSSTGLKQSLASYMSQGGSVGSITRIVPTVTAADGSTQPATLSQFLTALGIQPPDSLMRALSDQFFFGIHMADTPAPVFIIPVISYDNAFSGMLAWEANMDSDLSPLVRQIPAVEASPTGGLPIGRQFKDLVVQNYDVRGLEDDSGTLVLYYSFPTPNLLIIAASPYTFPEVLSRLQAEKKI